MSKSHIDRPSKVSKLPSKDAEFIKGVPVDDSAIADTKLLAYDAASGTIGFVAPGAGSGDVVGPAAATDLAIAIYDGATGKLIKNSLILIDGNDLKFVAVNPTMLINSGATTVVELAEAGTPTGWLKIEAAGAQVTLSAARAASSAHLRLVGFGPTGKVLVLDAVDPTKVARFEASGISAGTTRTFTFPNATGTFALENRLGEAHVDLLAVHTEVTF